MKLYKTLSVLLLLILTKNLFAQGKTTESLTVSEIIIEGIGKVEEDAITSLLTFEKNKPFHPQVITDNIRAIYDLGYFSNIDIYLIPQKGKNQLKIVVKEKPSLISIEYKGLEELKESDFKDSLKSKLYSIVNQGSLADDAQTIEKKYNEKGFYLAKVDYTLESRGSNQVAVIFNVKENGKILISDVHIIGNQLLSDYEIVTKLSQQPHVRKLFPSPTSSFQKEMIDRDQQIIEFLHREKGFAKFNMSRSIAEITNDLKYVRITHRIEPGRQYRVGKITVSGDIGPDYHQEKELIELMKLKPGKVFKYTGFQKDIEMLTDKYGDLGYAYADVNPRTNFQDEEGILDLNYEITKGQRVYFGEISISGNTKTRDNVIRRELEIFDSELYSGSKLSKSKYNINRVGFFEEVQPIKNRDPDNPDVINLHIKVKEKKSTGQLQASLGYQPDDITRNSFFGQGRYEEKNQSGKGWSTNVTAKWSNNQDYKLDLNFHDPRVNDSTWSLGLGGGYEVRLARYIVGLETREKITNLNANLGKNLVELIYGSVGISLVHTDQLDQLDEAERNFFSAGGRKHSLNLGLVRRDVNNFLDPNEGLVTRLFHNISGSLMGGDNHFMESSLDITHYYPIDFRESFRTYFKLHGNLGFLWKFDGKEIPPSERYRLGGYTNMRGYPFSSISPIEKVGRSPLSPYENFYLGGDKRMYYQFEYFIPILPEAGFKALLFTDIGQVFTEGEDISFSNLKKDAGFGFRWITPMAPLRFEWAYPYNDETSQWGDVQFIFTFGY